jgi:hypothetical protein
MQLRLRSLHAGFSLIEAIILVGIIAVVLCLILVAIPKLRDNDNQTACLEHLKQIGIAVHEHVDHHKRVPPAWTPDTVFGGKFLSADPGLTGTMHFLLLPHLQLSSVYQSSSGNSTNAGTYSTILPVFLCPADLSLESQRNVDGFASCNYAANLMVFDPRGTGNIIQAMPDGSSNTIMVSERYADCQGYQPAWANYPAAIGGRNNTPVFGWNEYAKESNIAVLGNPNYANASHGFQIGPTRSECDSTILQGAHRSGIMVGLGDGSVRSVTVAVSRQTWFDACHPANGDPLPQDISE